MRRRGDGAREMVDAIQASAVGATGPATLLREPGLPTAPAMSILVELPGIAVSTRLRAQ